MAGFRSRSAAFIETRIRRVWHANIKVYFGSEDVILRYPEWVPGKRLPSREVLTRGVLTTVGTDGMSTHFGDGTFEWWEGDLGQPISCCHLTKDDFPILKEDADISHKGVDGQHVALTVVAVVGSDMWWEWCWRSSRAGADTDAKKLKKKPFGSTKLPLLKQALNITCDHDKNLTIQTGWPY